MSGAPLVITVNFNMTHPKICHGDINDYMVQKFNKKMMNTMKVPCSYIYDFIDT